MSFRLDNKSLPTALNPLKFARSSVASSVPVSSKGTLQINICYDSATDIVSNVKSLTLIDSDSSEKTSSNIVSSAGIAEALFGSYENLLIVAKLESPGGVAVPVSHPSTTSGPFGVPQAAPSADGQYIVVEGQSQGDFEFAAVVRANKAGSNFTSSSPAAVVGQFATGSIADLQCNAGSTLATSAINLDSVKVNMTFCAFADSGHTTRFHIVKAIVTDAGTIQNDAPLSFTIDGNSVTDGNLTSLHSKTEDNVSLTYFWTHHNPGDSFVIKHPKIEINGTASHGGGCVPPLDSQLKMPCHSRPEGSSGLYYRVTRGNISTPVKHSRYSHFLDILPNDAAFLDISYSFLLNTLTELSSERINLFEVANTSGRRAICIDSMRLGQSQAFPALSNLAKNSEVFKAAFARVSGTANPEIVSMISGTEDSPKFIDIKYRTSATTTSNYRMYMCEQTTLQ